MPLLTRRKLAVALTTGLVTLALTVGSALAAELLGTIKSVDVDAKTITVTPKEGGDDVVIKTNDDTAWLNAKGKAIKNFDFGTKVKKKRQVEVTHENGVASKVLLKDGGKKKAQPPADDTKKDAPKSDEPKKDQPSPDAPKADAPKADTPK